MRIEPIKKHIGAIVEVERSRIGAPAVGEQCLELLEQYNVLVFPRINLTDEEQFALTDNMGKRFNFGQPTDTVYRVTLNPSITQSLEYIKGTYFWHVDGMTMREPPPKATLLSGRSPSAKGGETHFCNAYAGYETLPDEMKAEIDGLRVVHSLTPYLASIMEEPTDEDLGRCNRAPVNEYALVWKHASGRKSLLMGATAHYVKGMDLASGKALLGRLLEWTVQPDLSYFHKWQQGDLVIWNNHGVLHRATPYTAESGRDMHRTAIAGTEEVN